MRKICAGLALALLFAVPARAAEPSLLKGGSATPNFLGTTGLLLAPSAETVGDKGVSAHAYFQESFNSYGVQVGPIQRVEVGATFIDGNSSFDSNDLIFNAKVQLLKNSLLWPAVSVGVVDAFNELNVDASWYVVASKSFPKILPVLGGMKAHVGYGGGLFGENVFAGLELQLWTPLDLIPLEKPAFTAMAEFVNDNVNVGLRGRYRGFAVTLGLFDWDSFGGGVSYTTGLRLW